jgi:O-antigen ligase
MPHTQPLPDRFLYLGLLLLLAWAPLPFGSNRPWGVGLLFLMAVLLLVVWLMLFATGSLAVSASRARRLALPLLLLLLVQTWVFIQTLPLPRDWIVILSPRAALLHLTGERVPLSLDSSQTRLYLLAGLSYTMVFALTVLLINTRKRIVALLWVLTLSGAFQAVYGSLMALTGLEYGFFIQKYSGQGVATGTFINRNHLAGYLVMTLAAGIGLLVSRLEQDKSQTAREQLRAILKLLLSTKFLLRLLLAVMVIGLVLTRSRMGNMAFFGSLTIAGLLVLLCTGQRISRRMGLLFVSLLLVDLVIVGRWFGTVEIADRLLQTSVASESRDEVSLSTLGIIRDYPWTGSGAGTFYTVFPHYSEGVLEGDFYTHAHNDYLELAGDLGIPAFLLLAALVTGSFLRAIFLLIQSDSRLHAGLGFSVLMSVCWLMWHSLVDFNLQIPANALTVTVMLSLAWLENWENGSKSRHL